GRLQQRDAPHRLYEHPQSRFISGFVGKTNLLRGSWRAGALELAGGVRVAAPGDYPDGQPLTIVLRPEKISIGAGPVGGRITERFFLGSQWLYRVDCALGELEVACANDGGEPWPEQAEVTLDWAPDAARVTSACSGQGSRPTLAQATSS